MNTPALEVRDLSVRFDSRADSRHAVDGISFSIAAGEATALVGESGCGKTMTALAILGLLPDSGVHVESSAIEINGRDISALNASQRREILGRDIAMIFQQPGTALDPVFTLGRQISAVYARHCGGSKQHIRKTGGMRQLAMIAMATVCKPAVIIADEPTTSLDNSTRTVILQQLERLRTLHQTAILLVSHDLTIVRQSCQNVMVMYCGRLVEKTDCKSLFAHACHPYSAGLLSCIPQIADTRPAMINSIPGQVPAAGELPPGCHFAPRCQRAEAVCTQSVPAFDTDNGQAVACFRPL